MLSSEATRPITPAIPVPAAPPDAEGLGPGLGAVATPEPPPQAVEELAETLYNGLDPRFVDADWQHATEGVRDWARRRAQRLLAGSAGGRTA